MAGPIATEEGLHAAVRPVAGDTVVVSVIVPVKPPVAFNWTILAPPCPDGKVVAGLPALQKPEVMHVLVGWAATMKLPVITAWTGIEPNIPRASRTKGKQRYRNFRFDLDFKLNLHLM